MNKPSYTHTLHATTHQPVRQVTAMPWKADATSKPWDEKHERVFIPYTESEMRNRAHCNTKTGHIQIVRRSHLTSVKYKR